jgi:hypothetical protein
MGTSISQGQLSEQCRIDWRTAWVKDGTLFVELAGATQKGWPKRFREVLELLDLGEGRWGKVTLHKGAVKVMGVQPGSEEELCHMLEGIVLQANADFEPSAGVDEEPEAPDDPEAEADGRMTDLFRGFAERGA